MLLNNQKDIETFFETVEDPENTLVFAGFDPTNDGLHIGHLSVLTLLETFKAKGCHVFALIGEGTAKIGDPTGKNTSRPKMNEETLQKNILGIKEDIQKFLDVNFIKNTWLDEARLGDVLQNMFTQIPLSQLLSLQTIKTRLENNSGITLSEALYPALQGLDMVVMADIAETKMNCNRIIQVGGNDQIGNICIGLHLCGKFNPNIEASGALSAIIANKNGEKMGKTSGGALFLKEEKTDHLTLFDGLLSIPDDMFPAIVKILLPHHEKFNTKNLLQEDNFLELKKEIVKTLFIRIRGQKAFEDVQNIKNANTTEGLPEKTIVFKNEILLIDLLILAGITKTKSESRRLILQNGIKINHSCEGISQNTHFTQTQNFILSKGKSMHFHINLKKE